ncbi:MAG: bifunctional shikimate kinase/3-dehydroquinate synthase [Solirubrobacterales bacterium]|nr:bifunctional shikimate kinase/3-dehydroquinate synthase [Solirubrobacterales bacterium]HMT04850.1 bifunctional shikimate kinase/3-dehydroquinate synthase [Solirubrobacterales bacterium]
MICLVGFMGAGKSTALVELASQGLHAVDADALIESSANQTIPEIFERDGEEAFRELERDVLLGALSDPTIDALALGGGAVESEAIREALMVDGHTVVWLDISVDAAWRRVRSSSRPLARDEAAFRALFEKRQMLYNSVSDAILPGVARRVWDRAFEAVAALEDLPEGTRMFWARSSGGEYPVYVGRELLGSALFREGSPALPDSGRSFCFTDDSVGPMYADRLGDLAGTVTVPPGETAKTIARFDESLREMARMGVTRSDHLIALGGGVVGDLAGFVAHSYQRGIPVTQVPTTLVAQVDSAYGGKTGVDLPEGKNYVGAFHLPAAVISDVDVLSTLPEAELTAGMAEVVKTALLAGGALWEEVSALEPGEILSRADLVFACARYKCEVVAADERDTGLRAQLNLGHTVGHAIESVTGYERYRHGEAIALGLLAALRLSGAELLREQVRDWNLRHGLPVELDATVDPAAVVEAVQFDKKKTTRGVGFVLLNVPGQPLVDRMVDDAAILASVEELLPDGGVGK